MKHLCILLSMFFFSILEVFSQLPSMPSPTAANLGLYGEIPVSAYTGTPNISIPLYELQGKNIKVPVSLSYHASGIRPEVHPGPTGLGWTLFAGGAITRTVRGGAPDEYDARYTVEGRIYGYLSFGNNSWIAKSDWKTSQISVLESGSNCQYNSRSFVDFEADEFSFNFLGISGKFYFDQHGGIQVQSDRPLKVSFNPNNYLMMHELGFEYRSSDFSITTFFHRAIRDFVITDEFGTRYYFGGKNAVEISDPVSYGKDRSGNGSLPNGSQMCVTSWFINRIESADGADVITFEYERGPFVSQLYKHQNAYTYSGTHGSGWSYQGYGQYGSFVSPVYLTKISRFSETSITFSYSESQELDYPDVEYGKIFQIAYMDQYPWLNCTTQIPRLTGTSGLNNIRWLKLDEILVSESVHSQLKKANFRYNNLPTERLFLESVDFYGGTDIKQYSYKFGYKNRGNLRPYLQSITDHWGFDNGKGFTPSFSPSQRTPDALQSQNGILSSIEYPTGGTTAFEYQGHTYSQVVDNKDRTLVTSAGGNAGGVRIWKIISQDGNGGGFTKEYTYGTSPTATVSSGVLNATPAYSYNMEVIDCGGKKLTVSHSYSNPVIPLTQWNDGRYITYTDVCERRTDNGSNTGYIRYTFTNHNNGYTDVLLAGGQYHRAPFPKNPYNSRAFERGKLRYEYRYNAAGLPVYKKDITWERYGSQGEDNPRSMLSEPISDLASSSFGYVSFACYLNYVYKFLPSKEIETVYDANGANPVVKTIQYKYNPLGLEQERNETQSDGSQKGISTYYISDVVSASVGESAVSAGCSDEAKAWLKMYKLGMSGMPVERIEWTQRNGVKTYDAASCTGYSLFDDFPRLSAQYRFQPVAATTSYQRAELITCTPASSYDIRKDARLEPEERIEKYDSYGNPMLRRNRAGIPTTYLWSYGGRYLVAEIKNATYDQVKAAFGGTAPEFLLAITPNSALFEELRNHTQLKDALVTTFKYRRGVGLIESKDPMGLITTYEYDALGRPQRIKDHTGKVIEEYEYNYAQ